MWIFDGSDGGMRLLHLKDGHKAPPIRLRFHDELGEWVLSSGLDSSLRAFSTVADLLNRNLGTAHHNQNKARRLGQQATQHDVMPPICEFASGSKTLSQDPCRNILPLARLISLTITDEFRILAYFFCVSLMMF